jgi:hypothetical protein
MERLSGIAIPLIRRSVPAGFESAAIVVKATSPQTGSGPFGPDWKLLSGVRTGGVGGTPL